MHQYVEDIRYRHDSIYMGVWNCIDGGDMALDKFRILLVSVTNPVVKLVP
jgi:hypothetical protein